MHNINYQFGVYVASGLSCPGMELVFLEVHTGKEALTRNDGLRVSILKRYAELFVQM